MAGAALLDPLPAGDRRQQHEAALGARTGPAHGEGRRLARSRSLTLQPHAPARSFSPPPNRAPLFHEGRPEMTSTALRPSLLAAATLLAVSTSAATVRAQAALFEAPRDFLTGASAFSVAGADLDGDGKPDLAVANYGANSVSVLLGNADGTVRPAASFPAGINPHFVATADVNGDGRIDVVTANYGSDNVSVL